MNKRVHASMMAKKMSGLHYGTTKVPKWFYSFIPFKVSTGGTSILMPLYLLQLGGSAQDVGIMNSLGSLSSMLGALFWGRVSDRTLKRKVFIVTGFMSVTLFLLLLPFIDSVEGVILLNSIYTFFLATTLSVSIVLILRSLRKLNWDYGIGKFNEIGGWGWVLGLSLGLALSRILTIRQLFILFALLNIPSIILSLSWIREAPIYVNRQSIGVFINYVTEKMRYMPNFMLHIPNALKSLSRFKRFYTSSMLFWIATGLYFSQYPVFLIFRGFEKTHVYLAAIINSSISAYMYTRVGIMLKEKEGFKVLREGLILRFFGISLLVVGVFLNSVALFIIAILSYFLAGYSWSFIGISTTSIIGKLARENEKGTVMGVFNLVNSSGFIIGSFASGFIVQHFGFQTNFALASLFVFLSLIPIKGLKGSRC